MKTLEDYERSETIVFTQEFLHYFNLHKLGGITVEIIVFKVNTANGQIHVEWIERTLSYNTLSKSYTHSTKCDTYENELIEVLESLLAKGYKIVGTKLESKSVTIHEKLARNIEI